MGLSRRQFLGVAAGAALASSGLYRAVDRIATPVRRPVVLDSVLLSGPTTKKLPIEQHLFTNLASVIDNGVAVTVPPLHHMVVTAGLQVGATAAALQNAQQVLEAALAELEASGLLTFTPGGLGLAVGWGLPYFDQLPPALTAAQLPVDLVASRARGETTFAVLPAVQYPSDPPSTLLESNDVVFVFASDSLAHITTASEAIFKGPPGELFGVTSIRKGFVDGHHVGTATESLTKQMAMGAGIPGAAAIPASAELFLGFTSTQTAALGPSVIANLETLPGLTNQWPAGYFVGGTTMHLSHIFEDLVRWYGGPFGRRAGAAYSPAAGATAPPGTQTLPAGLSNVESVPQLRSDLARNGFVGHSTSMQPASRLASPVTSNYGTVYPPGTAIPQRADFNTLDNPFFFSSDPAGDHMSANPAAGVHFIAFMPTSGGFNAVRQAMDGNYPLPPGGGPPVSLGPQAVHGPFNAVLQATHRQNFLVPPRAHRSFPLAELL
jgi:hypothetical protein